ncbi:MAG: carbonic anhydrase family protein [Magnetococcales bacterium]|nr:carbonic anhydrase family protein [Magnetococcales bacterium]
MKKYCLLALAILSSSTFLSANATAKSAGHGGSNAHWGYTGAEGPNNWGHLGYPLCAEGKNQSPVDITASANTNLDKIEFHYASSAVNSTNNGHTVQFNYDAGSAITVGGKKYALLQFHFHAPSENKINGKPYPMEMHLVHKSDDGRLAVVGVFFQEEKSDHKKSADSHDETGNVSLNTVFGAFSGKTGLELQANVKINAKDLLPHDSTYLHFMGSLTTPPCSEGVSWFVMKDPVEITTQQLARFQAIYSNNARPAQAWNRRVPFERTSNSEGSHNSGH